MVAVGKSVLTEPSLLVPLDLDGQTEVGQLDRGALRLASQQQILRLKQRERRGEIQRVARPEILVVLRSVFGSLKNIFFFRYISVCTL